MHLSPEQFRSVLEYLDQAGHSENYQEVSQLVKTQQLTLKPEYQTIMQTFSDYLRHEGHQQGHQQGLHQGLHQGKLEAAKRLLKKGLELNFVKEALQLTESDLAELP